MAFQNFFQQVKQGQNLSRKYFVALCCTVVEIESMPFIGSIVGVDMGLKAFAIAVNGIMYPNHKYLAKFAKKLAKLQR